MYLHKDKAIFKVDELPADRFAESLGLPGAPKIKFLGKEIAKKKKNASRTVAALQAEIAEEQMAKQTHDSDITNDEDSSSEDETALPIDSAGAADVPSVSKASKVSPVSLPMPYSIKLVLVSPESALNLIGCLSARTKSLNTTTS